MQELILLYKFFKKGCQVVRMPMYRAFATFFEVVRVDRRLTGCVFQQQTVV
jgi:hypothetical protein